MSTSSKYSIKDLEALSAIKSHTIRIWEKRYDILTPERTDTNIRYYSNEDLKKLLNVSFLNQNGIKISKIAKMSLQEINEKVRDINISKSDNNVYIENLIIALVEINEPHFTKTMNNAVLKMGFENCISNVIFPFFNRIGVMWQTGAINPAQEHFVSNLVRHKIIAATEAISTPENPQLPKVVLLLPGNEMHELALLFYNYVLRSRGVRTVYLGQAVPPESIKRVVEAVHPDAMVCTLTNTLNTIELQGFLKQLRESFPGIALVNGAAIKTLSDSDLEGLVRFDDVNDLLGKLKV